MKQSINLYPPSCHPEKTKFSFMQLMLLIIACLLSIAVIESFIINREDKILVKQQQAQQKSVLLEQELSSLIIQLQAKRAPQSLLQTKQLLSEDVASKQRLLRNLQQIDLGLVVSFSQLMLGISKADTEQISIMQFSINQGKLAIKGEAMHSDSVPLWLTSVQKTNELALVSFTGVEITEHKERFQFQLSNIGLYKKDRGSK